MISHIQDHGKLDDSQSQRVAQRLVSNYPLLTIGVALMLGGFVGWFVKRR